MTRLRLRPSAVSLLLCAAALAGCGGGSPKPLSPDATRSALRAAGWSVKDSRGMTPLAGGRQLAYLDVRSPDGHAISLQLLEDADHARNELAAIHAGTTDSPADPRFQGLAIRNVLAFASPTGHQPLPSETATALRTLLDNA